MELPRALEEIEELLQISPVPEDIKSAVRAALEQLTLNARAQDGHNPYDLVRATVHDLAHGGILDEHNEEETAVFEAVKNVLWKAAYSAMGWKWPPQTI